MRASQTAADVWGTVHYIGNSDKSNYDHSLQPLSWEVKFKRLHYSDLLSCGFVVQEVQQIHTTSWHSAIHKDDYHCRKDKWQARSLRPTRDTGLPALDVASFFAATWAPQTAREATFLQMNAGNGAVTNVFGRTPTLPLAESNRRRLWQVIKRALDTLRTHTALRNYARHFSQALYGTLPKTKNTLERLTLHHKSEHTTHGFG